MKIAVSAETHPGESRVAATPDTIKAFIKKGFEVAVQAGAGSGAFISDDAFASVGAKVVPGDAALKDADILLSVRRPEARTTEALKKGAVVTAILDPYGDRAGLETLAKQGLTLFAMELMPRITRAQSMDVLSSQANLAGYKAVIDAAAEFSRAFPMMMTAAGTVPAAVIIIGKARLNWAAASITAL
jgi:NAD(P) transhydrogenase subunit alpha